jgi:glycosyltransferase involved in cell wall biosynthesis
LHPIKGLPLLLEAWAKVRPSNWILNIVGPDEGGHRAVLDRQVEMLGLSDRIRFSGPLTGVAKAHAFHEAELFILPTHSENFGIAVAEAMAHRLPVITTEGAPWELLQSERCGWWVPVSVDGIAAALDDATSRAPEELAAMGERGQAVVAQRFAWNGIAQQFIDCYRWILGQGSKPDCVIS